MKDRGNLSSEYVCVYIYIYIYIYTLFTEVNLLFYSRKHFSEEQASKWWAENGTKVCERLSVRSSEKNH
jgi:hypothetical protein